MAIRAAVLSIALAVITATPAFAQGPVIPEWPVTNVFAFNAGELLNGTIAVEHEVAFTKWFGLSSGFLLNVFHGVLVPSSQPSYVAFGPEFTARFHFIKDAPAGLWVGPALHVFYIASGSSRFIGYGVSALAGYNFLVSPHVMLMVGGGAGFKDLGDGLLWSPRVTLGIGIAI